MTNVSMVENWSDVDGIVEDYKPVSKLPAHGTVTIRIETIESVPPFPNLMEGWKGRSVDVFVPDRLTMRLHITHGLRVLLRLRRGGPTSVFAHPEIFEVKGPPSNDATPHRNLDK